MPADRSRQVQADRAASGALVKISEDGRGGARPAVVDGCAFLKGPAFLEACHPTCLVLVLSNRLVDGCGAAASRMRQSLSVLLAFLGTPVRLQIENCQLKIAN